MYIAPLLYFQIKAGFLEIFEKQVLQAFYLLITLNQLCMCFFIISLYQNVEHFFDFWMVTSVN
jgi:hypothetical protein